MVNWEDVRHQDAALQRLDRSLTSGRFPHALLFVGPDGVGKRMTALRVAQRLLCGEQSVGGPRAARGIGGAATDPGASSAARRACGRCDDCRAVAAGTHLDLHVIRRTMNKLHPDPLVRNRKATILSVDVVRHFLIIPAGHHPARGRAKVFIVEEAEKMNEAAENALLKTLEEPPGSSYLILLTTSEGQMRATTRSRCQAVGFGRLPDEFICEHLTRQLGVARGDAAYLSFLADGQMGLAVAYAQAGVAALRPRVEELVGLAAADPLAFSKAIQDVAKSLADATTTPDEADESAADAATDEEEEEDASDRAAARAQTVEQRASRQLALAMLAAAYRNMLRQAAGRPAQRGFGGPQGAAIAIRAIAEAESQFENSANVALVFDGLGIRLHRAWR